MSLLSGPTAALFPAPVERRVQPGFISVAETVLLPAAVFIAGFAAKILYFDLVLDASFATSTLVAVGALAALFLTLLNRAFRISSNDALLANKMQWGQLAASVTLTFLLLVSFFYLLKVSDAISRGWLVAWYGLSLAAVLLARAAVLSWVRHLRTHERLVQRVAIYGRRDLAQSVLDKLIATDGHQVVADIYSDDRSSDTGRDARSDLLSSDGGSSPVTGGMDELINTAQSETFDLVIVALPASADAEIREAASSLEMLPVDVQLSPGAISLPSQAVRHTEDHDGLLLLDIQKRPFQGHGEMIKTAMDVSIAAVALLVAAPFMLIIALAIKLDSRGPALFSQRRHGYNHRVVRVTKFRTMTVAEDGEAVPQAVRGDKRVTRVGRFLRRTSLDELPQLFDVLRGDMSLVGPRPHAVSHNEHYARLMLRYPIRHKVKPGITGWAQVNGWRGETRDTDAMRKRLEFDLYYIENWSLSLDLRILARTLLVPFNDPNAY